jgi:plasmid maintenance system antidote protein VapI
MNKRKLESLMKLHGDTQTTLAKAMGISVSRLNLKINQRNAEFTQSEIAFIIDRYHMNTDEAVACFFDPELS